VVHDTEPEVESDLRRRAAWLLGLLAVVAVLFVVIMTKVVGSGGAGPSHDRPGALDSAVLSQHPSAPASSTAVVSSPATASGSPQHTTSPKHHAKKCPTQQTCILDGDVGNGLAAINSYRTSHGQSAVSGRVSDQAQQCAVHNGSGCSGGWAETELAHANGAEAVQKILQFGRLLDPGVKSFEVGWAYDPGAKLYYFAIIRNE
jgi:hypothetical protein